MNGNINFFPIPNKAIITVKEALNKCVPSEYISPCKGQMWAIKQCKPGEKLSKYHKKGYWFSYVRLPLNKPSFCIQKQQAFKVYHYKENRCITINELLILFSFPHNFKMIGNYNEKWSLLGNCVLPEFMKAIATKTMSNLKELGIKKQDYTVISLFAGCGGSSLGYKWAGFKELLAIDFDKNAIETFKLNFPEIPIWQKDIKEIKGINILNFCNIKRGELDVLDGSPPCQGFSMAGKRNVCDKRNDLILGYIHLVDELQPKVFVMENVSGMIKGTMKGLFKEYMLKMKKLNYEVKCKLMNAKYYNVPQSRERLIWIGIRKDLHKNPIFPTPNKKLITVKEAIKDLEKKEYDKSINHVWVNEKEKDTVNYKRVLNTKQGHYYKPLRKRIKSNMPCLTIQTGGGIGIPYMLGNSFCHYKFDRTLSIRELARCHTYPNNFIFKNDMIYSPQQIGNSVPPLFMKAIAENIKINILD